MPKGLVVPRCREAPGGVPPLDDVEGCHGGRERVQVHVGIVSDGRDKARAGPAMLHLSEGNVLSRGEGQGPVPFEEQFAVWVEAD